MKKNKPPPGATLISRLKEGRLRREQALAARGALPAAPEPGHKTSAEDVSGAASPALRSGESLSVRQSRKEAAVGQTANFIQREISIQDLRPTSDDYQQLTDEIRLSGRFAAAGVIAQGLRLFRLKDEEIYKRRYPTFEEYCRAEHHMSATYAYRLIRMAEMAEHLADVRFQGTAGGSAALPLDPFEVMLGLGHRHLLALMPVEPEAAQELLLHGVPIADESGRKFARIPVVEATEKQIREALRRIRSHLSTRQAKRRSPAPPVRSVRSLTDLVEAMEQWAIWLESRPKPEILADKIGEGRQVGRLTQRLKSNSERLVEIIDEINKRKG